MWPRSNGRRGAEGGVQPGRKGLCTQACRPDRAAKAEIDVKAVADESGSGDLCMRSHQQEPRSPASLGKQPSAGLEPRWAGTSRSAIREDAGAAQPEQGTAAARRCRDMPLELTRRVHVAALNQHWHSAAVHLLHTVCGCLTGIVQDAPRVEGQCRWRHRRQGWGSSSSAWWDGR